MRLTGLCPAYVVSGGFSTVCIDWGRLPAGVGEAVAGGTENNCVRITIGSTSRAGTAGNLPLSCSRCRHPSFGDTDIACGWLAEQVPPRPDVEAIKQKDGRLAATQTELTLRDPASPDYATPVLETVRC